MNCNTCTALLALVDQQQARIEDLQARERYWRTEAVEHALQLMARDGEVRQLSDGKWERTYV